MYKNISKQNTSKKNIYNLTKNKYYNFNQI